MATFIILLVFIVVAGFLLYGLNCGKSKIPENFISEYNPSKFYTTKSPNKFEKADSLYSPFIWRPKDTYAHKYGGRCTNSLYPEKESKFGKGEIAGPCNPTVGGRYYGMRPILSPQTLQDMIKEIFRVITVKTPSAVDDSKLKYQNQFCSDENYSSAMKFILKKINQAQNNLQVFKDYAKADTWGGDNFAYLNEKVFMFTELDPSKFSEQDQAKRARKNNKQDTKFVVTFTLYLPLRSTSLDTTAIVIEHRGQYYLTYINFSTKEESREGPKAVNVQSSKAAEIVQPDYGDLPPEQNTPNWVYGNTLENKTFNLKGFHDPDENKNILIPGGVPDEYRKVLEKCDQGYLMTPANTSGPRFKGGFQNNLTTMEPPVYPNFPNKGEKWDVFV